MSVSLLIRSVTVSSSSTKPFTRQLNRRRCVGIFHVNAVYFFHLQLTVIIGLGCASSGSSVKEYHVFNNDASASQFAIAIFVLAFFFNIMSIVSDYLYGGISNVKRRRHILLSDVGGCALFAFLSFVCFCYLTHRWSNTSRKWLNQQGFEHWQWRNARSAIFFTFVAVVLWSCLTFLALVRFRQSGQGLFSATLSHPGMVGGEPGVEPSAVGGDFPPAGGPYTGTKGTPPSAGYPSQVPQPTGNVSSGYPGDGPDQYYPPTF
ncbi:unnamed protein product [Schistocephalus solidus]|uniref:MARVEL domain-containing protein n=1 Tax=Schistocephalus solidus TaxID=70667 RepID=A0A183T2J8_SCHSO|nr:unnamed protein product [Schistocephalus solidus]